jgi:hypothetical protein
MGTRFSMNKSRHFLQCWVLVGCIAFPHSSKADEPPQADSEAVSFFKNAISTPPDIEHFMVRNHHLTALPKSPIPRGAKVTHLEFFEGARSGSNYYLHAITDPASPATFLVGRTGGVSYEFTENSVSHGDPSSPIEKNSAGYYNAVTLYLNMGMSLYDPASVVWTGNQFTARTTSGETIRGELEQTNGLPCQLTINIITAKGDTFTRKREYTYPSLPASQQTFPKTILLFEQTNGTFSARAEIDIISISIAKEPLSDRFFDESNFKGSNVTHMNLYSNDSLYVSSKDGKRMIKIPSTEPRIPPAAQGRSKILFYTIIIILVAAGSVIAGKVIKYKS